MLWAGDFNQTLIGPDYGGTTEKRSLLQGVLRELGFAAYNQSAPHASEGMSAIDLVCGAKTLIPIQIETIPARQGGYTYSDHNGYFIEFSM